MTEEKIVNITNLHKSFYDKHVIKGVDLSLYSEESLIILGKSGSGKSVIMKCLVRLLETDQGEINVFGTDVVRCNEKSMNQVRSRIGYLFQEGALYDSMTILENLLFPAKRNPKMRKLSDKELIDIADHHLDSVGLIEAREKLPAELSGGMKKRAGLARTLMLSPELIIYDEPTTGLDPFTSDSIIVLMLKVKELYKTSSITITHDIKCAEATGDRLLMLSDGQIIAEGTFNELKDYPDDRVRYFFT